MLTCIACSKQQHTTGSLPEDDCDSAAPSPKQPIRTLTAQIRDMAMKASGAYKTFGPCSGSSNRAYMDSEAGSVSERFFGSYRRARTGSAMSSPRVWGKDMLKALLRLAVEASHLFSWRKMSLKNGLHRLSRGC